MPQSSATTQVLKQLFLFTKQLQLICKNTQGVQFTKTGLLFYGPGGLYANLLDEKGITPQGQSIVTTQLLDKLKSVGARMC